MTGTAWNQPEFNPRWNKGVLCAGKVTSTKFSGRSDQNGTKSITMYQENWKKWLGMLPMGVIVVLKAAQWPCFSPITSKNASYRSIWSIAAFLNVIYTLWQQTTRSIAMFFQMQPQVVDLWPHLQKCGHRIYFGTVNESNCSKTVRIWLDKKFVHISLFINQSNLNNNFSNINQIENINHAFATNAQLNSFHIQSVKYAKIDMEAKI